MRHILNWFGLQYRLCALCIYLSMIFRDRWRAKSSIVISRTLSTNDWITMEILRNITRPRVLKLQFAWNFVMAVLRLRERDTLKLSGYIGDDKFRNLREYKRNSELCVADFIKDLSWIIGLINFYSPTLATRYISLNRIK